MLCLVVATAPSAQAFMIATNFGIRRHAVVSPTKDVFSLNVAPKSTGSAFTKKQATKKSPQPVLMKEFQNRAKSDTAIVVKSMEERAKKDTELLMKQNPWLRPFLSNLQHFFSLWSDLSSFVSQQKAFIEMRAFVEYRAKRDTKLALRWMRDRAKKDTKIAKEAIQSAIANPPKTLAQFKSIEVFFAKLSNLVKFNKEVLDTVRASLLKRWETIFAAVKVQQQKFAPRASK